VLAFGARSLPLLAGLTAVNALLAVLLRAGALAVWRDVGRVLIFQTAVIVGLYLIRFGGDGLRPGLQVSWQLLMAFLPGVIFLNSTPHARIVQTLTRLLPARVAFVLATSIRFIPLVVREVKEIHEAQVFRGARILPRDLVRPWNWADLVNCLLVPIIVRSMVLAAEIAQAARSRDFGASPQRTAWPGA
jgi:energy-coupling factor transport system permease protein